MLYLFDYIRHHVWRSQSILLLITGCLFFFPACDEILDVSPPDVSFVYPKNNQTVSSSFTLELDVSDNKEVDEVKLYYTYSGYWEEEGLLGTLTAAPWNTNIYFSLSSPEYDMTFRAVAYDKVGNFSEASVSSVTVTPGGGGGSDSSITVTSPNGGESWAPGSNHYITWSSSSAGSYVIIHLYKNGSYTSSIASATANDGSYSWSIPSSQTESDYYTVKITDYYDSSVYDYSNGYFSIESGSSGSSITVTSPNGGESWAPGSTQNITWNGTGSGYVNISLYHTVDNADLTGTVDEQLSTISSYTSNDGSYSWSISSSLAAASNYKIRIADYNNSSVYDYSDGNFSIVSGSSGSNFYLNEDFEGSLSGWATGSTRPWGISGGDSYSGAYSLISSYVLSSQESWVSKEVSTPMYGTVYISFYFKSTGNTSCSGSFKLLARGNNSSVESLLNEWSVSYSDNADGWVQKTSSLNLNAIATPPTLIWKLEGSSGMCECYVDLVQVYD